MKPILVVMAAGMGSRYGGIKQIEPVGLAGEAIMEFSIFDARRAGFGKIVFVIRRDIETEIKDFLGGRIGSGGAVGYAFQELHNLPAGFAVPPGRSKPWGTAHAILAARDEVDAPFAVINADDFYGRDAYRVMAEYLTSLKDSSGDFAMVGYRLGNTLSENGSVSRGICKTDAKGYLVSLDEHIKIEKTPGGIVSRRDPEDMKLSGEAMASMNMFGFTPSLFPLLEREFAAFLRVRGNDPKAECYIPSVVGALAASGEARVKVLPTTAEWYGITYQADKPAVQAGIRALISRGEYPERLR